MVVEDMLGVVNDVPVPNEDPPIDTSYQFTVPAEAVAPNVTVPVPHREPGVVPVIDGTVLTVAVTGTLGLGAQPASVASA